MTEEDPTAIDPDEAKDEDLPSKPPIEVPSSEEGVEYDGEEEELPEEEFLDSTAAREDDTVDDEERPPSASKGR